MLQATDKMREMDFEADAESKRRSKRRFASMLI